MSAVTNVIKKAVGAVGSVVASAPEPQEVSEIESSDPARVAERTSRRSSAIASAAGSQAASGISNGPLGAKGDAQNRRKKRTVLGG